jgi:peptide/nickel transport system ATP-binding protein
MTSAIMLVTGGSRGIGAATARLAAERGHTVVINYANDAARAEALVAELAANGARVSAVRADVSREADVLRLFETVRDTYGTAILFIAHDLRIVRHLSDRVAVMQRGRIVELRDSAALFAAPEHEYTRTLIDSVLQPRYAPAQENLDA